jgi:peptidoglycan/xylan/chitin deacetylase (PgdA/CDA1 family)
MWLMDKGRETMSSKTNYRIFISISMALLMLICFLWVLQVVGWQRVNLAAASPAQEQGLTVLVLNNAVDVHSPETGSFYALNHLLNQMGIPFEIANWHAGFNQLDPMVYPLVIINDYIDQGETNSSKENALNTYVTNGGVVIAPQIIDAELQTLFGVTGYTDNTNRFFIKFTETNDSSMAYINQPEEITIQLGTPPPTYTQIYNVGIYIPSSTNTEIIANALDANEIVIGPTIVKHVTGTGRTYALGFSFFDTILRSESNRDFDAQRVFVDDFEPGADVIRLFIRAIYEEATGGHFIRKHTMPGPQDSALLVTHDVDAQEGYLENNNVDGWGVPVARQFADLEMQLGISATYFLTTKYVTDSDDIGFWYTPTVKYICDKGFDCQSHAVRHLYQITLPVTSDMCAETFATYVPLITPTLCGELNVSKELIENVTNKSVISFRSPFLSFHRNLPETLETLDYLYDSSFTGPDTLTNFPYPLMEETLFATETTIYEFPVTLDDFDLGPNPITNSNVITKWKRTITANRENNAINVLLIHPSKGRNCLDAKNPPCYRADFKLETERQIVNFAKTNNFLVTDLTSFAKFWRARDDILVDASYAKGTNSYTYTIVLTNTNADSISGLTLALGDYCINPKFHDSPYSANAMGNKIIFEQIDSNQVVNLTAVGCEIFMPLILKN